MRKLNLESYTVSVRDVNGTTKTMPYNFKESVIELMFHPNLKLSGKALLETNIIAEKIMKADKEILLEEADYQKIKSAVDGFNGFSKNEVELVRRVLECPEIKVKEEK